MQVKDFFRHRVLTLSNILTLFRVLLIPFVVYLFQLSPFLYEYNYYIASIVFIIALTDLLDGYLARKLGQETPLGQYLDPLADKLCVMVGVYLLVIYRDFPVFIFIFIIFREVVGTIAGVFIATKKDILGKPNIWGKLGVALITIAFFMYLFNTPYKIYICILIVVSFLAGIVQYFLTYKKIIFGRRSQTPPASTSKKN